MEKSYFPLILEKKIVSQALYEAQECVLLIRRLLCLYLAFNRMFSCIVSNWHICDLLIELKSQRNSIKKSWHRLLKVNLVSNSACGLSLYVVIFLICQLLLNQIAFYCLLTPNRKMTAHILQLISK